MIIIKTKPNHWGLRYVGKISMEIIPTDKYGDILAVTCTPAYEHGPEDLPVTRMAIWDNIPMSQVEKIEGR